MVVHNDVVGTHDVATNGVAILVVLVQENASRIVAYFGIPVQIGSSRRSTNKLSCKPNLIKVPKLLDATFKAPKGKVIRGLLMA